MYEEKIIYEYTKAVEYIKGHSRFGSLIKPDTTIIGKRCFAKCDRNVVRIPDSVKIIEEDAFSGCKNLTEVSLSNNLETIKERAFDKCNLKFFQLPDSIKEIKRLAFSGVKDSVKEFYLPKNLEKIDFLAFGHLNVDKLYIPKNVIDFSSVAFKNVKEFIIDKDNPKYTSVDGNLYSKDLKTLIRLGNNNKILNVETIAYGSFWNTHSDKIELSKSVKTIEEKAFIDAKIKTLIIPESVDSIDTNAFNFLKCKEIITDNKNIEVKDGGVYKIDSFTDKCLIYYMSLRDETSFKVADECIKINKFAFEKTKLETVDFGKGSMLTIDKDAFNSCNKLTVLKIKRPISLDINDVIDGTKVKTFSLPNGSHILGSPTKECNIIVSENDYKKYKPFVKRQAILEKQKPLEELIKSSKSFKEINDIYKEIER